MKKLIIEQLKEGFLFSDENDEKYAVSSGSMSRKVHAYFGMTRPGSHKKTEIKKTADNKLVRRGQCAEILEIPGFDSPAAPLILHPSDLKIAKFDYDLLAKTRKYKTLEVLELPDGRVVLKYGATRYYSTKEKVMQIPFPFPRGQFNKENGWSSTVEYAFKMYRRYLAERKEPEGLPDGTCDDVSFDTCANNDPKTCKFCVDESRYEDKRKIAARKPGKPLLKARMGV